jgi:hypothetical protein
LFWYGPRLKPNYPPNAELDSFANPPPPPPTFTSHGEEVDAGKFKIKLVAIYDRVQKRGISADGKALDPEAVKQFEATHIPFPEDKSTYVFEYQGLSRNSVDLFVMTGNAEDSGFDVYSAPRVPAGGNELVIDRHQALSGEPISFSLSVGDPLKLIPQAIITFNIAGSPAKKAAVAKGKHP